MTATMRAAVLHGPQDVRMEEVPSPSPGPGEVVVRVRAALTCGTDVKVFRRGYHARMITPPALFGHEMAGVVVKQGPGATRIAVGETVAVETHIVDWTCYQCQTGRAHVCQNMKILGVHMPGAFAEYVVLPEMNAWVNVASSLWSATSATCATIGPDDVSPPRCPKR